MTLPPDPYLILPPDPYLILKLFFESIISVNPNPNPGYDL